MLYTGCVENRKDPLKLGRCQVRIVGLHTHDKTVLPTEDLPWAHPLQPINSAAISGIGVSPVGLVEGTWVVLMFRDEDQQQPIILGSIGGIPQKESNSVDKDIEESITIDSGKSLPSVDANGRVVSSGQTPWQEKQANTELDANGNPVRNAGIETVENTNADSSKSAGKVPGPGTKAGIDAVNAAMTAQGITSKYARAAIQAIIGGESDWIPCNENYNYSADALKIVFKNTFANRDDLAQQYARWKGTRESFFNFVYSPRNNGAGLGNIEEGDGGRYYGRGLIQLTGRSNYVRYARLTGTSIDSSPEILVNDMSTSATVAVAYFLDRVRGDQNSPSYFVNALQAVGGARSGWAKKEAYYKYFLGESAPVKQTDKSTAPGEEIQNVEVDPNSGLPRDRQHQVVIGFNDPNMKYPLRQYIGEPDTNRLARGRIDGTIVEYKDEKRLDNVTSALGFSWSQPDIPYNAKYPYNKVMESESGHIMEFDDTPENERVHIYHRKGTYTEIDANGTQVNRIVGDGYTILERNGYVSISGECNVTISGTTRILCQNDANIEILGDTRIDMAGNSKFNVAGDFDINVGGEFNVKSGSTSKIESGSSFHVLSGGAARITSSGAFDLSAGDSANIEAPFIYLAQGASSAMPTGLGSAIGSGTKSTQSFQQLKPPPRNLEEEIEYETPEEQTEDGATEYHENRNKTDVDQQPVEEVESSNADTTNQTEEIRGECAAIYNMTSIPDSYVLHTDDTGFRWTVGMLSRGNNISSIMYRGKLVKLQDIVCNMKGLAENILGPINQTIGRHGSIWNITSCYRNNIPSGGSSTSQHLIGCAVDFVVGNNSFAYKSNYDVAIRLSSVLAYDQLLLEYRDPGINGNRNPQKINWIHVSYNNTGRGRKQALTLLNDRTYSTGFKYLA